MHILSSQRHKPLTCAIRMPRVHSCNRSRLDSGDSYAVTARLVDHLQTVGHLKCIASWRCIKSFGGQKGGSSEPPRTSPTYRPANLMTTGAFSRNVGKLFSELKLVTDNLLFIYTKLVSVNNEFHNSTLIEVLVLASALFQ